jgi:hypothetical protein
MAQGRLWQGRMGGQNPPGFTMGIVNAAPLNDGDKVHYGVTNEYTAACEGNPMEWAFPGG